MFAVIAAAAFVFTSPHRLQHPATPTRIEVGNLPSVLASAHEDIFGSKPSKNRLAMAVGQVRLEGLALPGRNLGGLEYEPGLPWVRVDRLTRLRAFDSYTDAARAYWRLLRERCEGALYAFDSGDPTESARRLKRCGFYHSSEEQYRKGLTALRR